MVNIDVNVNTNDPSPEKERTVFAFGWIRYQSTASKASSAIDNVQVLGLMVVQDEAAPNVSNKPREA